VPNSRGADPMRCAVEEWFAKIDKSVAEAKAQACIYFDCRMVSDKKCRRIALVFADRKGKSFRRTLKCDERFQRHGSPLSRGELVDLKIAVQSMIINEGQVVMDPKAKWMIPKPH
jgi:hypothetical protein